MRLSPASCAAWSKPVNERTTGLPLLSTSVTSVDVKLTLAPKKAARTVEAAPLKVLWPEMYSGKLGVVKKGCQVGSAVTRGLPAPDGSWMTVIGRQVS